MLDVIYTPSRASLGGGLKYAFLQDVIRGLCLMGDDTKLKKSVFNLCPLTETSQNLMKEFNQTAFGVLCPDETAH